MNRLIQTCFIMSISVPAWGDTNVTSFTNPFIGVESSEILMNESHEATRLPRRDTKTSLVCSAADAAPKLADRMAQGSCRSHTEDHQVDNRPEAKPWVQRPFDIQSFSGR